MLIFLCIILLFSLTACQKQTLYFKDIHLGMSRDEIIKVKKEWGSPQISEQNYLLYENIKYDNLIGETDFTLDTNGKLTMSNIIFISKEKDSSNVYDELIKNLSAEYGEATKLHDNTTMWNIEFDGKNSYILCIHDMTNKNVSVILCTPEIYDGIINFKSTIVDPTK